MLEHPVRNEQALTGSGQVDRRGIAPWVASIPVGITILLEGQALGTPAAVAVPPGRSLILRRMGAADVTVLDPRADVTIPVWPAATVLPVRAPLPGGGLTDLQVLADGRLALAVASAAAPYRTPGLAAGSHAGALRAGRADDARQHPAGRHIQFAPGPTADHAITRFAGASRALCDTFLTTLVQVARDNALGRARSSSSWSATQNRTRRPPLADLRTMRGWGPSVGRSRTCTPIQVCLCGRAHHSGSSRSSNASLTACCGVSVRPVVQAVAQSTGDS